MTNDKTSAVHFPKTSPQGGGRARINSIQNTLLRNLPPKEQKTALAKLEWINLPTHMVLSETGKPIDFAYFLNDGLASILTVMSNKKTVEVGLAGKEGFVGVPLLAGLSTSPNRIVMQVGGNGFRIRAQDMAPTFRDCATLDMQSQRYAQELAMQATQAAACNRLHGITERLARWLLMSQDRLGGNLVPLTQQYLSHMLGTRRASVTVAAGALQRAKIITYNRGTVKIENRSKLEGASCECYEMMKRQSRRWQTD